MPTSPQSHPTKEVFNSETPTGHEQDDKELVAAAQVDPCAFGPLYERYVGPIYRYCYIRLGDHEAAEDATSEVFTKALAGLNGYRDGVFIAWLFRIASNVIIDAYRRRSHQTYPIEDASDIADTALTPEAAAVTQAEQAALRTAIAALPVEYRTVLELQLAGWKGEQIASALDKTYAAVKMLRWRALARLRTSLCPLFDHDMNEVQGA